MTTPEWAFQILLQVHDANGFDSAFHQATGLRVCLRPLPSPDGSLGILPLENPICRLAVETPIGRALCQEMQARIRQELLSGRSVEPFCCSMGMMILAVPVRLCGEPIAMLHTNRLRIQPPGASELEQTTRRLNEWGVRVTVEQVAKAVNELAILNRVQLEAVGRLLHIYAEHLGDLASRRILADRLGKPCALAQALAYIREHYAQPLPLRKISGQVHLSPHYFCKLFHRTMGMTFTQYLTRVRLERAKDLLLNPALTVGEVATAVGFGSIPHFNRSFKKYTGITPTRYRALHGGRDRLPLLPS
ncbi:MAG: AraC family transcriptional regulator [Verrucomicrobiota bacterium]|nr:AraC family transcriptional regulator [Limisphaera sp.]MDW8381797.1 AraC family transcriptional regulator [Verrucomicrobiota bacterium]